MADEVLKITVEVNPNAIEDQIESLLDDTTMMRIHQLLADMCDPYVPYLSGKLHRDVIVNSEGVTYTSGYAAKQYYGTEFNHNLEHHPLASALWDKAMLTDHEEEFLNGVREILVRRANELYG